MTTLITILFFAGITIGIFIFLLGLIGDINCKLFLHILYNCDIFIILYIFTWMFLMYYYWNVIIYYTNSLLL